MKLIQRIVGLAFLGLLVIGFILGLHQLCRATENAPEIKVDSTPVDRDPRSGNSFAPVVKKVAPSVVNIFTTRFVHEQPARSPFQNDPIFRQFFGDQFPDNSDNREHIRREESLGSGVVVSSDGYILTANHVVAEADEVKVSLGNSKKEYSARIIGKDAGTDVAVLKISAENLPAITMADSDQLEVGDMVLAIGDPFGVGQTVTRGIVSALGRSGFDFDGANSSHSQIENFIQTDAAINPGNSGGALVDTEGRLVGINTAIISPSGGNNGIGFAVPVNMARTVLERLILRGKVVRGYLGVVPQDLDAGLAQQFGINDQNGALVADVWPASPAGKVGIKSGDVILSVNDKPVTGADNLKAIISQLDPGTHAKLSLIRDDSPLTLTVVLGAPPDNGEPGAGKQILENVNPKPDALAGVTVADLDPSAKSQLNMPENLDGAIVVRVENDSNAADAGLMVNDVIVEINRQAVKNSDDAWRLGRAAQGDHILVKVWRRYGASGTTYYLSVDNTKRPQ